MKTLDEARGLMEHGQALDELDFQRALANVASNLLGDGGPPPQVGRFSLRDRVGAGGMGVVYSAFDPQLDRTVAIKLLHPDATDGGGDPAGPDAHELLLREARSLAKLRHPNVVTIHEVGTEGRRLFLAMEFIAGEPLDSWMRTSPPWQEVVAVLRDAGQGLAAAHDAGIVHRDFKPSNVILGEDGRVTVIDFGLARVDSTAQPTNDDAHEGAMSSAPLTQRGAVVGTPAYMAPEQHRGRNAGPASDQYAFCVSTYEALFGQLPFATTSRAQLLLDIEEGRRAPLPGRPVPAWLRRVLDRGLRPEVEDRWPDMRALLAAMDPAPRRRRRNRVALGVTGVAALVLAQRLAGASERCTDAARQLDGVWPEPTAATLDDKFGADPAWPRVRAALDAFATQWQGHWSEACRATHVDGSQSPEALDKRMACLDHHRGQLAAFVDGLEQGDADVLARAAARVEDLEAGQGCGNAEAMLVQAPPPSDPDRRATFRRIIRNAQAGGLKAQLLGRPTEALAELQQLYVEAAELAHPRALRFVASARGDAFDELDKTAESIEAFETAMRHAEAAGDDLAALDLASSLIYLHATRVLDPVKAAMWSTFAENKLARVRDVPVPVRIGLRINQASALEMNGKFKQAVEVLDDVLATLPAEGYERHRGTVLHNRASAYRDLGEFALATEDLRAAVATREVAVGAEHRLTGESKLALAYLLAQEGATVEADAMLADAVVILRATEGTARDLVEAQQQRAILAAESGDMDRAIVLMQQAIEDGKRVLGAGAEDVTNMQYNLARMLMMAERPDEAMVAARRSLDALEQKYGSEHTLLTVDLGLVAEIQLQQKRPAEAAETLERALQLASTEVDRGALRGLRILAGLAVHCDVERAQTEAQREIERLQALPSTPGIAATVTELQARSASWAAEARPESCAPVVEDAEP